MARPRTAERLAREEQKARHIGTHETYRMSTEEARKLAEGISEAAAVPPKPEAMDPRSPDMGEAKRRREAEAAVAMRRAAVDRTAVQEAMMALLEQEAARLQGGDPPAVARFSIASGSLAQGMALLAGEDPPLLPFPVQGERLQPRENLELLNRLRFVQAQIATMIDGIQEGLHQLADVAERSAGLRWLAIGRTDLERGFMMVERSVLRPLGGLAGPPQQQPVPAPTAAQETRNGSGGT